MARLEPYVHVEEVIKDFPTLLSIDGSANIGCTIVSAVGPQLAYIDSPSKFLKTYTKDGVTVPRDAHITWINAYYMSFFAGMVIARSMNSAAQGGLRVYRQNDDGGGHSIQTIKTYYKDGIELLYKDYLSLKIGANPSYDEDGDLILPNWAFVLDDVVFYGGDKDEAIATLYAATPTFTRDETTHKVTGLTKLTTVSYTGPDKTATEVDALFAEKAVDLSAYDSVACDVLFDEESDQTYQVQILDYIAAYLNQQAVYTAVRETDHLNIYRDEATDAPVLNQITILNDDSELEQIYIAPRATTPTVTGEDDARVVSYDVNATTVVTGGNAWCIPGEANSALATTEKAKYDVLFPDGQPSETLDPVLLFEVICKTPGTFNDNSNVIAMSKTKSLQGHKIFTLTLRNGAYNDFEDYVVSLDPDGVDYSEVNCFLEGLNSIQELEFTFKVPEEVQAKTGSAQYTWEKKLERAYFGEGFIKQDLSSSTAYLKQALDTLEDQELYQIAYLAPCGLTSVSYIKTYTAMGERNKWFCPVDVPYDRTNVNSITAYGRNILDSYNVYMVGPFDKNSGLTGWIVYIAATTLYYERVMINRAARSEFAPVFDMNTGLLAYTAPTKLLKKSAREQLISLSTPINYVIYNQRTKAYYLNDNWTHYSKSENIMGEECSVRMVHKISRDLQQLYQQFKARYNNDQTRRELINITDIYFQTQIMNQNFCPQEYLVICDSTNNTDYIINSRKLAVTVKIRLYKSIKYIEVLNEIYSVGGVPFTE
jgi:hypothetical protein